MRSLLTAAIAGLLGFAAAKMGGSSSVAKRSASPAPATPVPSPAREPAAVAAPAPVSPSPDPAKPIADRLNDARRAKDPMEAAARSLAVIDAMTIEDFQKLSAEPRRMPIPHFPSYDREFCDGFMDALIARWLEVDPAGAFASIQEVEKGLIIKPGSVWVGSGDFFAALARVRPEVVLDALGNPATWDRFDQTVPTAIAALAARDPAAARRFVNRTDEAMRMSADSAFLNGLAKNDPVAAAESLRGRGSSGLLDRVVAEAERRGPGVLRQVLAVTDGKARLGSPPTELVLRHPNEDWSTVADDTSDLDAINKYLERQRDASLGVSSSESGIDVRALRAARDLPAEQRAQILARLETIPVTVRESVTNALVNAWALEDPRAATEWALAHTKTGFAWTLDRWLDTDASGVIAWWSQLPASEQRAKIGGKIGGSLATAGKLKEALEFFLHRPGGATPEVAAAIVRAQAKDDPAGAAAWLDALPPNLNTATAIGPIVTQWVERDAAAAARWAETRPEGAARDAAVSAYARAAAELDPAAAGEWAATIADPAARAKAAEFVFREMNRRDPPTARAFLRKLPGADSAWSERLIRLER